MSTESANRMVWDRRRPGHYEVWYTTFSQPSTGTGFWIRYTLESPLPGHGDATCQVWFAFFDARDPSRNLALNKRFSLDALQAERDPFRLGMGPCEMSHGALRGALNGDAHDVSWDLAFTPTIFVHRHLPDIAYRNARIASTQVLSPNLMIHVKGRVTVDGETFDMGGGAPGCQTHLWGRKHAHAWAWGHCSAFRDDPTACIEALTVRVHRLGLTTPPLTWFSLYLGSEVYHFRHLGAVVRTRGRWDTGRYLFRGIGRRVRVACEMSCRPEDLVMAQYSDPDGEQSFCHNTEVGDANLTVWTRRSSGAPFKRLCHLTSQGGAHFEYAGRAADGRVIKRHIPVP